MDQYLSDARIFKAFCDENRLQILELLRTGEKCACALLEQLHISQSTLSYHMRILCDSGIVSRPHRGKVDPLPDLPGRQPNGLRRRLLALHPAIPPCPFWRLSVWEVKATPKRWFFFSFIYRKF